MYSYLDVIGNTYRATKGTSNWAAGTFREAAQPYGPFSIPVLKQGLRAKAKILKMGKGIPATDSCAVAKAWAANKYTGARKLIGKAMGTEVYKKNKRALNKAYWQVQRAGKRIMNHVGGTLAAEFMELPQQRAVMIWAVGGARLADDQPS